MPTITHVGPTFALGSIDGAYAIWPRGREQAAPIRTFAIDEAGWRAAWTQFIDWDPQGQALNSPSLVPVQRPTPNGQAVQVHPNYAPHWQLTAQPAASGNGLATAGGVIGIVGAVLSLIPLLGIFIGIPMGLLALVFGSIGLGKGGPAHVGRGMAITGLVLGILTIVFKLIPGVNLI